MTFEFYTGTNLLEWTLRDEGRKPFLGHAEGSLSSTSSLLKSLLVVSITLGHSRPPHSSFSPLSYSWSEVSLLGPFRVWITQILPLQGHETTMKSKVSLVTEGGRQEWGTLGPGQKLFNKRLVRDWEDVRKDIWNQRTT